jgi:hypothetical protein
MSTCAMAPCSRASDALFSLEDDDDDTMLSVCILVVRACWCVGEMIVRVCLHVISVCVSGRRRGGGTRNMK